MLQQLRDHELLGRILLEATVDEASELQRGGGRWLQRIGVAYGAHERGPAPLLAEILPEGEVGTCLGSIWPPKLQMSPA